MICKVESQDTDRIEYIANITDDYQVENCKVIYFDEDGGKVTDHEMQIVPEEIKQRLFDEKDHQDEIRKIYGSDANYDSSKDYCAEGF